MNDAQLSTLDAIKTYALAGNARMTVRSEKTGTRFTYRLRQSKDGAVTFVSVLSGSNNDGDYTFLGVVTPDGYRRGQKSTVGPAAPSAVAFAWFWGAVTSDVLPSTVAVFHDGRCGRCGRSLTTPESVQSGLGPDCAKMMQ